MALTSIAVTTSAVVQGPPWHARARSPWTRTPSRHRTAAPYPHDLATAVIEFRAGIQQLRASLELLAVRSGDWADG
jgi:hypothetical protein